MKIIKLYTFKKEKITAALVRFIEVQNSATSPLRQEKEKKNKKKYTIVLIFSFHY